MSRKFAEFALSWNGELYVLSQNLSKLMDLVRSVEKKARIGRLRYQEWLIREFIGAVGLTYRLYSRYGGSVLGVLVGANPNLMKEKSVVTQIIVTMDANPAKTVQVTWEVRRSECGFVAETPPSDGPFGFATYTLPEPGTPLARYKFADLEEVRKESLLRGFGLHPIWHYPTVDLEPCYRSLIQMESLVPWKDKAIMD